MRELDFVEPAEVGMDSERLEAGRRLMDDQFERGASPILVAVVARSGKVVFSHCRGLARPGGDHVTVDSVFPLNSATKSMTAAVLMTLVEEGRVGITDRVVDYIPELDACDNDGVLLHHLLTHTAGWDSEAILARRESLVASGDLGTPPSGMDMMQHVMLNLYWDIPRSRPAGEAMVYETWNYGLLGEIIRRVTGVSLHAAMTERLFKPLGMTRSAVIVRDDLEPRVIERPHGIPLAEGHGAFTPARAPSMLVCDDGSFGGHASALDMVRFGQLFLNGGVVDGQRLLSQASIRVMTTNQIPGTPSALLGRVFREASWSYGFSIANEEAWPSFGGATTPNGSLRHGGLGGIHTWIDLEHDLNGVYFEMVTEMDSDGWSTSGVAHRFEDVVTGATTT